MRQKIRKGVLTLTGLFFPVLFLWLSPFIIVIAASHGIISASAIMFGILFLISLIGSRLFCGWLCPAGAIQDQVAKSNDKPWNSRGKNLSKYVIWIIWFSFIIFLWIHHRTFKINLLYLCGINKYIVIIYFIVVMLIYLFTLLTGKRGMCHSLCWMAPFMIIGEKAADFLHIPRFRLKANSESCIACGQCNRQCPMSLNVCKMVKNNDMEHSECIFCLECVDVCPKKSIQYGIRKSNKADKRQD
ncbi:4Fe-4S binding protein [Aminipila terrae]|uniref:4Fe-4S binding protein n=1 Tax=Aminipila terrae TaxID=2697030 RepID=A0A6P1MPF6_9FIRM|nr:4Fe-4S binding protein [Aminipila terrae]QHI73556.1 4Fe-4S binding protein [Aminipila terrae]